MNANTCKKCGKPDPEHAFLFTAVDVQSNSTSARSGKRTVTTTTTRESVSGVEAACFCDQCIKKKRLSRATGIAFLGFVGSFFGLTILSLIIPISKSTYNSNAGVIFLIIGLIAAAAAIAAFISTMKEKPGITAADLMKQVNKTNAPGVAKKYVNMDPSLYKDKQGKGDLNAFKRETGLKTGVADALFLQIMAPGVASQLYQINQK